MAYVKKKSADFGLCCAWAVRITRIALFSIEEIIIKYKLRQNARTSQGAHH